MGARSMQRGWDGVLLIDTRKALKEFRRFDTVLHRTGDGYTS